MPCKIPHTLTGLALMMLSPVVAANTPLPPTDPSLSTLLAEGTAAVPLNRMVPKYPKRAASAGKEGWVVMSYVIEPDGHVSHAIVEDSSGQREFERAAMRAVKRWTFEPATENGKPIQQCNTSIRMDFEMKKATSGASRRFVRRYKESQALLQAGKLDEARAALDELKARPKWNLYEDAWYWLAMAHYYQAVKDPKRQLSALSRAAGRQGRYLDESLYVSALQQIFILQLQQSRYRGALETYDRLADTEAGRQQATDWLSYQQQIKAVLAGPESFGVQGKIGDKSLWVHRLSRREFAFADVLGTLDKLDIRCDRKKHSFSFSADSAWKLPQSWGECSVYVYGEPATQFTLVELPAASAATSG